MKKFTPPTQRERDKYRAAQEAGLLERVLEVGWAGLTAQGKSVELVGCWRIKTESRDNVRRFCKRICRTLMGDFIPDYDAWSAH